MSVVIGRTVGLAILVGRAPDDDDELRFNDASTHEGHLHQNGELTWFCNEAIIMISHKVEHQTSKHGITGWSLASGTYFLSLFLL